MNCLIYRFSCGSVTPVSSDSSESTPANEGTQRDPPTALPLDLLTEMEFLFKNERRRDSLPDNAPSSDISLPEKAVSVYYVLLSIRQISKNKQHSGVSHPIKITKGLTRLYSGFVL